MNYSHKEERINSEVLAKAEPFLGHVPVLPIPFVDEEELIMLAEAEQRRDLTYGNSWNTHSLVGYCDLHLG